ncbi:MAG: tetratricopeptide repeat protein [Spirochaetia bacterium]
MIHARMALVPFLTVFLCLALPLLPAESSNPSSDITDGIDLFRDGQYDKAIQFLRTFLQNSPYDTQKAAAYLLLAKSYIAIGSLNEAEKNLEYYIANYPRAADIQEALYQKGRLLFMQDDFENSLQSLQSFLATYPKSTFVPSAWFWIGESLYGLGRLDEAQSAYQKILTDYPSSVKVEAAQYKVSLIQLTQKEVELARLLKWSHEEFLKSTEEFQAREKTYQQAIEAYQKRLAGSGATATEDQKTLADLRQALASKTEEANNLAAQLAKTGTSTGTAPAGTAPAAPATPEADQLAKLQRLLAAEQKALALKEIYLAWLETHVGAGK